MSTIMKEMSSFDPNQIQRYVFDEVNRANRVTLVGLNDLEVNVDTDKLSEKLALVVKDGFHQLIRNEPSSPPEITLNPTFNVPEAKVIIQKEVEKIEVPVIVEKTVVQFVEKPVIIEKVVVEYVEKPVIVKELVEIKQSLPKWVMIVMGIQSLFIVGLMIVK